MSDLARQQPILNMVDEIMASAKGTIPDYHYELILQHTIRALRDVRTNHSMRYISYSKQTPGSINEVSIPTDAEEIIGVAVPVNGQVWFLKRNDAIITTTTTVLGSETQDSDVGEGVSLATSASDNFFSRAKNPEGYYTIDWNNSRLMLNNVSRDEVILVYKTSGVNSDTYIPNKYQEAIEAYVYMKYFCTPDVPVSQRQYYRMQYNAAVNKLKQSELNMIDLMAVIREAYTPLTTR